MMDQGRPDHRYQMVNIRSGYVIVEHEVHSRAMRSYFSPEPVPPIEEYREGPQIWKFTGMAQTVHFDLRDCETGVVGQIVRISTDDDMLQIRGVEQVDQPG